MNAKFVKASLLAGIWILSGAHGENLNEILDKITIDLNGKKESGTTNSTPRAKDSAEDAPLSPTRGGATSGTSDSLKSVTKESPYENSLGMKFVPVPGTGTYFCIWSTRVSDYEKFVAGTGRPWKPAGFPQGKIHPAVRVDFLDATAFCKWLTDREGKSGRLPDGYEYRLPRDLEWSSAVGIGREIPGSPAWRSGGIPRAYSWGSSWPPPPGAGNYDPKLKTDKYEYTSPVGSFSPNRLGLFDMNGNVYQWIQEPFDDSGQGCVRGGSWADEEEESINLTNRFPSPLESNFKCYGFRCVLAPVEQGLE